MKGNGEEKKNTSSEGFDDFLSGLDHDSRRIWEEARYSGAFSHIDVESDWKQFRSGIAQGHSSVSGPKLIIKWALRVAAVTILAAGLTYVLKKRSLPVVYTPLLITNDASGSVKEIVLPDGSSVTLNVGSVLTYYDDFNNGKRDVHLEGEGLFSVVPDSDAPFRVFTGNSVIQVTGTTFSVYQKNEITEVAVLEGKVLLSSAEDSEKQLEILQNQSGYLNEDGLAIREGIDKNELSWKTGMLIFDETPLDSALIDIAHHFRKDLKLETTIYDDITAEFQNQTLAEILGEIEQVAELVFDTTGGALTVSR